MKDFEDKVVVIPGGATGIGFASGQEFGGHGAASDLARVDVRTLVATLQEAGDGNRQPLIRGEPLVLIPPRQGARLNPTWKEKQ